VAGQASNGVHAASGLGRSAGNDLPMVARAKELERVLSVLEKVRALSRGQVVVLAGEPGIGKTRLARAALTAAHARGAHVFSARCFEQHTSVPFFPFAEAFGAALVDARPDLQPDVHSRWPELTHIVPDLGARVRKKGQATQLQVFRAAAAFLHELSASHPIVLLLDDLHWADSTSLDLLLYVARYLQDARILILGTYREVDVVRQHSLQSTLQELIRERLVEEIHLDRFSSAGTAQLVRSRFPDEDVTEELVALVHERAQGNPFFTEELLAAFIEMGGLSRPDSESQTAAFADLRVPRSIRTVIGARVRRLPRESHDLLILASILGQEFDLDALLAVSDIKETEVFAGLDAALVAGLLQESRAGHGERFAFAHALIQETLYEDLPAYRRRRLHLRIGQVLENLPGHQTTTSAELARHFLHGGDTAKAVIYALKAGDNAASHYAHAEAAHHYAIAVEVLRESGDFPRAAEVQCRMAAELLDLNRVSEARAAYDGALAVFQQLGDDAGQAVAQWGLGRLSLGRYEMRAAATYLDAALRLWPAGREDADLARLMVDSARAKVFSANQAAAAQLAERAITLAERLSDAGLLARALYGAADAHLADSRDSILIRLLDRAEGLAQDASDWRTLNRVYLNRAVSRLNMGELEKALADNRRAVEAADRSGDTQRLRFAYQALSVHCLLAGAWQDGRDAARAALALDPQGRFSGLATAAALAWMDGRNDDALSELRTFGSEARDKGDVQGVADTTALLADFSLQLERISDAEGPARESAEVTRSSWPHTSGDIAILAETLTCLHAADAEAVLAYAERVVEQTGKELARPQLLRARARLLLMHGNVPGAIDALQASAAIARSQHALVQEGRTLSLLADIARKHGDQSLATRADTEGAAIVERIGPEVCRLPWAQGLQSARKHQSKRVRSAPTEPDTLLSPREREVAALLAAGLTDRQIAEQLVITQGTAGVHVGHILTKLGFHTRTQIANWVIQHRPGAEPDAVRTQTC
jgi:DNA-binding NarL/FixJ family response regulator